MSVRALVLKPSASSSRWERGKKNFRLGSQSCFCRLSLMPSALERKRAEVFLSFASSAILAMAIASAYI